MSSDMEKAKTLDSIAVDDFVSSVRSLAEDRIIKALSKSTLGVDIDVKAMTPGKMLRTRLAGRLCTEDWSSIDRTSLEGVCAAIELVHTASLCHDDVIDNSLIRRSLPTLWKIVGASGAILIGDLLLCEAVDIVMDIENGRYLPGLVGKIKQVVQSEAQQELLWRGTQVDMDTCMQLARGKTGPLFAFVAEICGSDNENKALCGLLEETGYRIGTAYQLADDLLDILGTECTVGKTLGTDVIRGKFTLPRIGEAGTRVAQESIGNLCNSAVELLDDHPKAKKGLTEFLCCDLYPLIEQTLGVEMGIAV